MLRKPFSKKQVHDRVAHEINNSMYSQDMIGWRVGNKAKSTVNAWKNPNEDRIPDYETMCKLADVLGVDVSYLYGFTDIERIEYHDTEAVHDAVVGATDKLRRANWFSSARVPDSEAVRSLSGLSKRIRLRTWGIFQNHAAGEKDHD